MLSTRSPNHWTFSRIVGGIRRRLRSYAAVFRLPGKLIERQKSRAIQKHAFAAQSYTDCNRLVVFFIPGSQHVTGGALQIFTLHRITRKYFAGTGTDALICWLPNEGWWFHQFSGMKNDVVVFPLPMVLDSCKSNCKLLFHVPEYIAPQFFDRLGDALLGKLRASNTLQINIMNQNIQVMPGRPEIEKMLKIIPGITITAGHPLWASAAEQKRLGVPIRFIPTWYYPDDAPWQPFESKSNILIVSPDADPNRELVLNVIRESLPDLKIMVIYGLKYEAYLELERKAKWSLTFGEGLDGYFYGPVLRGGVSFAVRNNTFDVAGLQNQRTIYQDYKTLATQIVNDIRELDSKAVYERYNQNLRAPILKVLGRDTIADQVAEFYQSIWPTKSNRDQIRKINA